MALKNNKMAYVNSRTSVKRNPSKPEDWANLKKFNIEKYKVLHLHRCYSAVEARRQLLRRTQRLGGHQVKQQPKVPSFHE